MSNQNFALDVLFEDNHLIIVNKPPGILVQSDQTGDIPLVDKVKEYLAEKYNKPGNVFCGVIHRLDRPVSGLVIFAKTSKALVRMNELFREHENIQKKYLAIVLQKPKNQEDILIHWLVKNTQKLYAMVYNQEVRNSQRAELSFRYISSKEKYHLLEISLKTGRFHQIRAQLSKIGSIIVGDLKYGASIPNKDASICLHSWECSFLHPVKNENMTIQAPFPKSNAWLSFSL